MTSQTITLTIAGLTITVTVDTPAIPAVSDAPVASVTTAFVGDTRTPIPHSSVIAFASYNVVTRTLTIEFQSGKTYAYDGVPEYVFDELLETNSAGRYFNYYIKDKYPTRDITR